MTTSALSQYVTESPCSRFAGAGKSELGPQPLCGSNTSNLKAQPQMTPPFRYARSQAAIHWLSAALIGFILVTGTFVLADMPNTAAKIGNLRIHVILGMAAGLLVVARIVMSRRRPAPAPGPSERWGRIAHVLLNAVMLLLVASGAALALQSGATDAVFLGAPMPADFKVFTLRQVHGLLSRVAMGLIALHILAALYHQFVLKDGLLSRLSLGRR
jgi:cytochrome b561